MKKLIVIFLIIVTFGVVFAGGQRVDVTAGKTARVGTKGSLPLATSNPTLTMFIPGGYDHNRTSFDAKDNIFTKKVVDETGINLVVTSTNAADAQERLNIMLNTGDYPDIVYSALTTIDMDYYARQGIFIPLDSYEPTSFPLIKRAFDLYPQAKMKITGSDGKIYALPLVDFCLHCDYAYGRVWYYMPWVRDNNRKVPETLDELKDFLRMAKNNDPNKNGRNDEVGIAFMKDDLYNFVAYIAKAHMPFVYTGDYFGLAMDNNKKVVEQYRDNNFRAALTYLAGLYKEGLILPDAFSMSREQLQVVARSEDTITPLLGGAWYIDAVPNMGDKYMEYFNLPPLKTAGGQRYSSNRDPWGNLLSNYSVTNKCKDPELAIALYDYFIRDDVMKWAYGPENVFWVNPDPGAVGYDGKPAFWKWIGVLGEEPLNSNWGNYSPQIWDAKFKEGIQMDDVETARRYMATGDKSLKDRVQANISYGEYMWYNISMETSKYALPNDMFIPPLLMDQIDRARYSDIYAVFDPFMKQVLVEFITGVRDINNNTHWNNYLSELDRMGTKDMIQIIQKYIR